MEMLDAQQYLGGAPAHYVDSADMILICSDNKSALVHSALLAWHSTVLSSLLSDLTSKEGNAKRPIKVPFKEFSGEHALELLKVLYDKRFALKSILSAEMAALFAHKYDAMFLRNSADEYLSEHLACAKKQAQARVY